MPQTEKRQYRVVSLQFKTVAVIVVAALILSSIVVTISYRVYSSAMDSHYKKLTSNLAKTAVSQLSAEELADQGIKPNTIRLSIGTEHVDDIIEDLEQAFAQV